MKKLINSFTYNELKKENRKALSALIALWEELSRCSRESARKDLKDCWGTRYEVVNEFNNGKYNLIFKDSYSGDIFVWESGMWK